MKIEDLRILTQAELIEKMEGLKKQLMELQFKCKTGIEKPHQFKVIKRDIARILTVLGAKKRSESKVI